MSQQITSASEVKSKQELSIDMKTPARDDRPVYLAGNFNAWQVTDDRYRLAKIAPGHYRFNFEAAGQLPPVLEYKYHRGEWADVELDRYGNAIPNRRVARADLPVSDYVPRWMNSGYSYSPALLPNIRVIAHDFEIPQLIKTRRIAALLPHNYDQTDKRYPVLYLQDGQNLFDDHAPFGNWAVDKKLAILSELGLGDLIVIAIDHAEEDRIREFTPTTSTRLGSGDGKRYVRFLADTLKPYVDQHFRTLPDRRHTGIGGSSMGALISIYAGMMYPEEYSKLLVFSPSLWVAPNMHFQAIHFEEAFDTKIYIYGGEGESANMIPNIRRFKKALEESGNTGQIEFNLSVEPHGEHNEQRWGAEFPKAIEWLFFGSGQDKEE